MELQEAQVRRRGRRGGGRVVGERGRPRRDDIGKVGLRCEGMSGVFGVVAWGFVVVRWIWI